MGKEYFSHDYNTRSDEKVKLMIRRHGMAGYGIFWALVEDLYQNANALQLDCEGIASDYKTTEDVIRSIIFDFGLFKFQKSKNIFSSDTVASRLEMRKEKSVRATKSAEYRWGNRNAIALQTQSEGNAIKEKESKVNKSKEIIPPTPKGDGDQEIFKNLFSENFITTWQDYRDHRAAMKKKFKSTKSENLAMVELHRIAAGDEGTAKKIVEKSIGSGWQGLFPLDEGRLSGKTINLTTSQKITNLVNHGQYLTVEDELWAKVTGSFIQGRLQMEGANIVLEQAGRVHLVIYPTEGFKSNKHYELKPGNTIQKVYELLKNKMGKTG